MRFPKLSLSCTAAVLASLSAAACSSDTKDTARGPIANTGGASSGSKADWTMMGYDLGSTYWNTAETKISVQSAPSLDKAWEFDTQAGVTSTPVISGGRVYFASVGIFALDLATGAQIWKNEALGASSSMAMDGGILYLNDSPGVIHALDPSDGHEIWAYTPEDTWGLVGFSSPVITKDYVLVGASGLEEVTADVKVAGAVAKTRGSIIAVNKKDGTKAWQKYTVEPPYTGVGIWSTLAVDEPGGLIVAGTGNNYTGPAGDTSDAFLGLKLDGTGDFLWKPQIFKGDVSPGMPGTPDGDFGANPILFEAGGKKLAAGGAKMGDVWVVDRADGTVIKQRNLGPGSAFKGGIFINGAWDGTSILVACNGGTSTGPGSEGSGAALFALDPLTLDVNWERQIGGSVWGAITVANGVGFVGKDKILQAFNTATGEVLKEFPTEGSIATAPAVSNGYVVFGSGMSWFSSTAGSKYYALKVP